MSAPGILPERKLILDRLDTETGTLERRRAVQRGFGTTIPTCRPNGEPGTRRPRTREEFEAISNAEIGRAVLKSRQFWEIAWCLPGNTLNTKRRGKPAHYPAWVYLFLATMVTVWGTQRGAITQVCLDRPTWLAYRRLAKKHLPPGFSLPPKEPPKRHHLAYFLRLWRRPDWAPVVEQAIEAFRGTSVEFATSLGHLPEGEPLRYDQPNPAQWIAFDGTVYPGPTSKEPHELKRFDPASGWHNALCDDSVRRWGTKFVFASMRSEDYHGRVILDLEHVRGPLDSSEIGDEGKAIVAMAKRLQKEAPGMRGVIVDGVLRHVHIHHLSSLNLHTINYPTAEKNPDGEKPGTPNSSREEKKEKLTTVTHRRRNGRSCQHHIWAIGGSLAETALDSTGTEAWVDIPHTKVSSRKNRDNTWRHYLHATLTCNGQAVPFNVPLHHQPQNGPVLSRGEVLRYYSPSSWQFGLLYGRRNDTESLHQQMKRQMPRLPAYGISGQRLFVLAYAIRHNATTAALVNRLRT